MALFLQHTTSSGVEIRLHFVVVIRVALNWVLVISGFIETNLSLIQCLSCMEKGKNQLMYSAYFLYVLKPFLFKFKMAFMAMKKNLEERARKKGFDEIFDKFDHNKNGLFYSKF